MARPGRCAVVAVAATAALAGCGSAATPASLRNRTTTSTTTVPPVGPLSPASSTASTVPIAPTTTMTTVPVPPHPASTTTTTAVSPQTALARLEAGLPTHRYAVSAVQDAGGLTFVVVARDVSTRQSVIDVDVYEGDAFRPEVTGIGASENLDPVAPGTISSARITTSALPDFLVLLQGSQSGTGVILSDVGGSWHTLGLEDRSGAAASHELVQPHLSGAEVTQSIAVCAPDCSAGPYSVTTYGYDPSTGELAQVGPVEQSPTP